MKKIFLPIMSMALIFTACDVNTESPVRYQVTNASSGFMVNYRDEDGALIRDTITTQSAQDIWTYSFRAVEGDIVFVSARYKDINSAIKVQVFVDGKIYKEGSSKYDTVSYVTVSGTIPY